MVLSYGARRVAQACGIPAVGCCNMFIDLLIVGCGSDRNLNPSSRVVAYGIKGDLLLNAMVGFYLNESLVVADAC